MKFTSVYLMLSSSLRDQHSYFVGAGLLLSGILLSQTGCRPDKPPTLTIAAPQKGIIDTIRYGGDYRYAPFESLSTQGQPQGFNVDLIRAIGRELGAVVVVEMAPWYEIMTKVRQRQIDVACSFYTPQRDTFVDYAFYHNVIYHDLITRQGELANLRLENIGGKEVILERDIVIADLIREKYPTAQITYVASEAAALTLLASGRHDCAIVSDYQSHQFIKERNDHRLVPRGSPILPLEYAFVVPEGNRTMLNQLSLAVAKLKATGEYSDIYYQHFGRTRNIGVWIRRIGLYVVLPLLSLLLVVSFWTWLLQKQVAKRTRELRQQLFVRKKIEKQLLDQSAVLMKSQQMARLGSWTYAPKTGWATWSDEQCRIFGMEPGAKPPRVSELVAMIHPDDRPLMTEMGTMAPDNPAIFNSDFRVTLPNGEEKWMHLTSFPRYDQQGELEELYGTVMDITQRKATEQTLHDKHEALKKVNEELDKFVYRSSHDMRAPLASIQGLINVMRLEPPVRWSKDYLGMIETSTQRLNLFIEEIISYAINKNAEITSAEVDVYQLTQEAFEQHRYLPDADRIQLTIDPPTNMTVRSDPSRLRILINSLISNAIKYHDYDKPSPYVKVTVEPTADVRLRITIEDNGIGIQKKFIDNIFTMFYQANDLRKGSGLGLYIVQDTLNKLGGSIEVTSELGLGTRFTMIVPIIAQEQLAAQWDEA